EQYLEATTCRIPDGARAEVRLGVRPWLAASASRLERGALLIVDYGQEAERLFCHARPRGTLRCYVGHTANDDPLARVGLQDITADVDLTGLRRLAAAQGFDPCGSGESQRAALERLRLPLLRRRPARADLTESARTAN